MSEFAGFDLDRSTARAWGSFQSRLADHVAAMEDDDVLFVEAEASGEEDEGCAPYVQFCAWGEDLVRCELSSNTYLADEHVLDAAAAAALEALGWSGPTRGEDDAPDEGSTNFFLDLERNHADRLAVMTVRAFRDVFGVAHPAFLSSDKLAVTEVQERPGADEGEVDDVPLAIHPEDREHLQSLVDQALVPVFGHLPEHDEDDDVPVANGSGLVWVRVLEDAPVVHLFSALVCDVTDLDRAAFEVAVLNRDVQFLKFVLVEDTVMAHLYLPALPFAPLHLRAMLDLMSLTVDRVDDDLATRVGGRRAFDTSPTDEETAATEEPTHPAMRTLLELDAGAPGSVDPELAASICGQDRELLLDLIRENGEQERSWRDARDEAVLDGDRDDVAGVCERETEQAERMTDLLRRALRIVVEREAGRNSERPGYDSGRGPRPLRRRSRDEVLPGLDGREPGLFEQ
ncbi:MAG: hypothetical protein ABIQ59_17905 [Nocardioidaceae bacterium]